MGPDQIEEEFQERINLLQEAHLDTDWKLVHEETEDWPNQTKNPGPAASPQILDAEAFNGVLDMKIYRYIGQNAKTDMRFKLVME